MDSESKEYYHRISQRRGEPVESRETSSVVKLKWTTGRILLRTFSGRGTAWANLFIEMFVMFKFSDGGTGHYSEEYTYLERLPGAVEFPPMNEMVLSDLLLQRELVWLAEGCCAGLAQKDAVWNIIWRGVKTSDQMREALKVWFPNWIESLDLEENDG